MNKAPALYGFLILLLCFAMRIHAQNTQDYNFDRITTENFKIEKGLSQNSANCIAQDSRGYIWIGTWDGLNRYDGYSFKTFRPSLASEKGEISNQTINIIYEDRRGNLWIGTEKGLNLYIAGKQSFVHYNRNPKFPLSISSDTIWSLYEDPYGKMWVGTQNGLNLFDRDWGMFYHFNLNPDNANSPSNDVIHSITMDYNGNLVFGTDKGLNVFNPRTRVFSHYYHDPANENTISDDLIWYLYYDMKENIWICTNNGLDVYNYRTKKLRHFRHDPTDPYSLSDNQVRHVLEDRDGNIWVGTFGGGLDLLDTATGKFTHYKNDIYNPRSISSNYINQVFQDNSGIVWVATAWKGVSKIDRYSNRFRHFEHTSNNENSLNDSKVWSIFQDSDNILWIGTDRGVNIYNPETEKFRFLTSEPGNQNSLPGNYARCVYKDMLGLIWIGTYDDGLSCYNPSTGKFKNYKHDPRNPSSLSWDRVWIIEEDLYGRLWIGTDNGLNLFNRNSGTFTRYYYDPSDDLSVAGNAIANICTDREGFLWICTYNGLSIMNPYTLTFNTFRRSEGSQNTLSSNKVFCVYEDKDHILWIGTCGAGLNRYDRKTGEFRYYFEENGLPNNVVYNIFEDKSGFLWMTTNYGLTRFDRKTEDFINYDVKDGIQSNEFNLNSAFHNPKTDEMFFGGMNGFNAFVPDKIIKNKFIPPVVISAFRIFDEYQAGEIQSGDTLFLDYDDNFFSFEFSALDYSNPGKNKYAYILENYDNHWNYCDAFRRFAGYTKVPPGTYIFRLKGTNSDGIWNEKGTVLTIVITPPWWKTWWFRTLTVLLIAFIAWYIVFLRLRNIRIKHEDEKRILEIEKQMFSLEQTALRLQMNPHFIFNSLNSIQSFVVANDTDKAIHYLAKFSQLMRLILSNSQQTFVPVKDEIRAMSIYLDIEQLRFDNKFSYEFVIDDEIEDEFMEIPPMIIQPYIENAILHGILNKEGHGNITISIAVMDDNYLICRVEDDGIGREKAAEIKARSDLQHKSKGMFITQKRLEILNKQRKDEINVTITDLKDGQGQACGTRVEIIIVFREN